MQTDSAEYVRARAYIAHTKTAANTLYRRRYYTAVIIIVVVVVAREKPIFIFIRFECFEITAGAGADTQPVMKKNWVSPDKTRRYNNFHCIRARACEQIHSNCRREIQSAFHFIDYVLRLRTSRRSFASPQHKISH